MAMGSNSADPDARLETSETELAGAETPREAGSDGEDVLKENTATKKAPSENAPPEKLVNERPRDSDVASERASSDNVVVDEPGFVGRLLGEKPRVFLTVSEGESLTIELRETISTESATTGDRFTAALTKSVLVEGLDALPKGTLISGHVAHAQRSDKVKGRAQLTLELDSLELDSGEQHELQADPFRFEAESTQKDDAVKIGGAGGVGAVVGGLIGGKKGAAIGAGIGAGAGAGVVLTTRGDEVVVQAGAPLSTILRADVTVEQVEPAAPTSDNES
jgi:hypothetical protein